MQFLIIMVLMLGVMYVLMIRPQRQRQAQQQSMIDRADVGDDVLTSGGIYGTITEADEEDVVVEIAPGVSVHLTRRAIAAVLPPDEDDDEGEYRRTVRWFIASAAIMLLALLLTMVESAA